MNGITSCTLVCLIGVSMLFAAALGLLSPTLEKTDGMLLGLAGILEAIYLALRQIYYQLQKK